MGVPTLEVGYTSATTGRGDHEVHKGHVVAFEKKLKKNIGTFEHAIKIVVGMSSLWHQQMLEFSN
jgi:hypothetical protein